MTNPFNNPPPPGGTKIGSKKTSYNNNRKHAGCLGILTIQFHPIPNPNQNRTEPKRRLKGIRVGIVERGILTLLLFIIPPTFSLVTTSATIFQPSTIPSSPPARSPSVHVAVATDSQSLSRGKDIRREGKGAKKSKRRHTSPKTSKLLLQKEGARSRHQQQQQQNNNMKVRLPFFLSFHSNLTQPSHPSHYFPLPACLANLHIRKEMTLCTAYRHVAFSSSPALPSPLQSITCPLTTCVAECCIRTFTTYGKKSAD